MKLISYLKQPFPKAENKWKVIIQIALFVILFLLIFQPFGIGRIESNSERILFIGGFGLVSIVVLIFDLIIVERLFSRFFEEKNWCVYKELLWLLFVISSIGLGNVLYVTSLSSEPLSFNFILNFQALTFAVALFPIGVFTLIKQNYLLKKYTTSAEDANENLEIFSPILQESKTVTVYSYNEKQKEEFAISNLNFIESRGNDIILHLDENNLALRKMLRNTLKNTLKYLANSPELVQCHRAYIVNLNNVNKVEGNSQGLVLRFANSDAEVPVSRSFVNSIKSQLNSSL